MTVWTRLKEELDRAGRMAQVAMDEGKIRLELMRTRQLADRAAQTLGYEYFRAKQAAKEIDAEVHTRLVTALDAHLVEIARQEATLASMVASRRPAASEPPAPTN
jgi:hypothetical protein